MTQIIKTKNNKKSVHCNQQLEKKKASVILDKQKIDSTITLWDGVFKFVSMDFISNFLVMYQVSKAMDELEPKLRDKVHDSVIAKIKSKKHCLDNDVCCTGKCMQFTKKKSKKK